MESLVMRDLRKCIMYSLVLLVVIEVAQCVMEQLKIIARSAQTQTTCSLMVNAIQFAHKKLLTSALTLLLIKISYRLSVFV